MKISISLDEGEVAFVDKFAGDHGVPSRSAVIQRAIAVLRALELGDDYASAWDEWEESGEAGIWDSTAADGLTPKAS